MVMVIITIIYSPIQRSNLDFPQKTTLTDTKLPLQQIWIISERNDGITQVHDLLRLKSDLIYLSEFVNVKFWCRLFDGQ